MATGKGKAGVRFTVYGDPVPQGSKRAFVVGSRAVIVDDNRSGLKTWRSELVSAARAALDGGAPLEGPVAVVIDFYLKKPQRPRYALPATRPDGDKLERAVLDGLTAAGVIHDDGQVTSMSWRKVYAEDVGARRARITVEGVIADTTSS